MSYEQFSHEEVAAYRAAQKEMDALPSKPVEPVRHILPVRSKSDRLKMAARMALKATALTPRPGVYFLLDEDGETVYVGQSGNVACRLAGHADKVYASVKMIEIPNTDERLQWEALFIKLLNPVYNKQGTTA